MKCYSHLEDYIRDLLLSFSIRAPDALNIQTISSLLNLKVIYGDVSLRYNNYIVLKKASPEKEWQTFGHEIGHVLMHVGNQLYMPPPFREYQEWKANIFMYHFCVPTFMLDQIDLPINQYEAVSLIAHTFNVEYEFARKRLEKLFLKRRQRVMKGCY